MSVKTHYTAAATWTPDAWISKYRAVVAGGAGGDASGVSNSGGGGAILSGVLATSASVSIGVGSIAGGAKGTATAGDGGAASACGGIVAGAGGGSGYPLPGSPYASYQGGTATAANDNAGISNGRAPFTTAAGKCAVGDVGGAGGTGYSTAGTAGQSHSAGGAGGAGGHVSGGGGGGEAGGGGGAATDQGGGAIIGAGGGAGSSTFGAATETAFLGNNFGAPYVDTYIAGAPKAPTPLSPTGNVYQDRTAAIILSLAHNPDTPGDSLDAQTDARFQYRKVGASTWTTVDSLGTATATSIAANTLDAAQYEWQGATKADGVAGDDATGTWGAWTDSQYFRAATPPSSPTITSPAALDTIAVATMTMAWTAPGQVESQARLVGDLAGVADPLTVYSDTGAVTSATGSATLAAMTNHVDAHAQVRVRTTAGGLWSAWADVKVSIEWAGPPTPRVSVGLDGPALVITVTNPAPTGVEPAADENWIYITETDRTGVLVEERRQIIPATTGAITAWTYHVPIGAVGVRVVAVYAATGVTTSTEVLW